MKRKLPRSVIEQSLTGCYPRHDDYQDSNEAEPMAQGHTLTEIMDELRAAVEARIEERS